MSEPRYRVRLFSRAGRWWPTREEAEESAIRRKLASRDEYTGTVYLSPGVEIERDPPSDYQAAIERANRRRR